MLLVSPLKSGTSNSIFMSFISFLIVLTTFLKCSAPPSGKSSLVTEVITTYFKPKFFMVFANLTGSSLSVSKGLPCVVAQKAQFLEQTSPNIIKVAVLCLKHSPILGHFAAWHTVCNPLCLKLFFSKSKSAKLILFFSTTKILRIFHPFYIR